MKGQGESTGAKNASNEVPVRGRVTSKKASMGRTSSKVGKARKLGTEKPLRLTKAQQVELMDKGFQEMCHIQQSLEILEKRKKEFGDAGKAYRIPVLVPKDKQL